MKHISQFIILLAAAPILACNSGESNSTPADASSVPLYTNLGSHHYEIAARAPGAQAYFDQGLRLYYAFNHAEAIRAFSEAIRLDPQCAICHWGVAMSYGPNINLPMDAASEAEGYSAVQRAVALRQHATPVQVALIDALATRYTSPSRADRTPLDSAYARAMRQVAEQFPDDPEAATLYAEAIMDLSPWNYWTRDGQPRPDTPDALAHLERALAANPNHPGANHFFIHAVEAVQPERAVPMAERLATLMPGAGHLVHMPGHIYIRVGRYQDAIAANEHAVHADESYIRDSKPAAGVYTMGYYPHNHDFLAFASSLIGRSRQSISAAEGIVALTPAEMLSQPGFTFAQHHHTRHLQMKIRFAQWDAILQSPAPAENLKHARAMWHYARGRALAATGDGTGAQAELAQLQAASRDTVLTALPVEFNTVGQVLRVAASVLAGHIAAASGKHTEAVTHLREAVREEDAMKYGEPPEWSIPVRQELGVVLLAAGRATDAEAVFLDDLKRFPENGWSLAGLARSLNAQGKGSQAADVERRLAAAWSGADVPVPVTRN